MEALGDENEKPDSPQIACSQVPAYALNGSRFGTLCI
jgi:hypothetical protein